MIGGIGWFFGGPSAAVVCFAIGAILIVFGLTKGVRPRWRRAMFDAVEKIHRALGIESTLAFVLIIALGSALIFGIMGGAVAWIVDADYKHSSEYKAKHSPKQQTVAPNNAASQGATVQSTPTNGMQGSTSTAAAPLSKTNDKKVAKLSVSNAKKRVASQASTAPLKRVADLNDAEYRTFFDLSGQLLREWNKTHNDEFATKPPTSPEWWAWRRSETIKRIGVDIGASSTGSCPENTAFMITNAHHGTMNNNSLSGNGTATCASNTGTVEMNGNQAIRPAPAVPNPAPPQVTLQNSPGSAVSYNQQGGITAGTINLGSPSSLYSYDGAVRKTVSGGRIVATAGNPDATVIKIQTKIAARQEQEALSDAQTLIASDPQWATPHILAGLAYVNIGDLAAAKGELHKAQALIPSGYEYEDSYIPHLANLKEAIERSENK